MEGVNYYYDRTPDRRHSADDGEATLIVLCDSCAAKLGSDVQFAARSDWWESSCWLCDEQDGE